MAEKRKTAAGAVGTAAAAAAAAAAAEDGEITLLIRPRGKPIRSLPSELRIASRASTLELHARLAAATRGAIRSPHRLRVTRASDGAVVRAAADLPLTAAFAGGSSSTTTTTAASSSSSALSSPLDDKNSNNDSGSSGGGGGVGLRDGTVLYVKDLGPQIGWRTVFVIEYLGPLLIHPLVFFVLRPYIYRFPGSGSSDAATTATATASTTATTATIIPKPSPLQALLLALICAHFAKRELETLFVHRFASATMPARNLLKNCAHYWLLGGANLAYWLYSPHAAIAATPVMAPGTLVSGLAGLLSSGSSGGGTTLGSTTHAAIVATITATATASTTTATTAAGTVTTTRTVTATTTTVTAAAVASAVFTYAAVALFVGAELANFATHMTLRRLRSPGSTSSSSASSASSSASPASSSPFEKGSDDKRASDTATTDPTTADSSTTPTTTTTTTTTARGIPHGWGFDALTCPNYLYEALAWLAVAALARASAAAVLFAAVAAAQMAVWARRRETRYRADFGAGYRRKRWAMIPGVI